jgi:glycine/D-amino acid oxidase-like deaminating enzyme
VKLQKPTTKIDALIVGQGLAGTLLAWKLMRRGRSLLMVDNNHRTAASRTAAGLINPVTGMRLVKTLRVEECLPSAKESYQALEQLLKRELWFEIPMLRLIRNPKERQAWDKRCGDPAYKPFLRESLEAGQCPPGVIAPEGGFVQRHTGYMDTCALMDGFRDHLREINSYRESEFDWGELQVTETGVIWRDISAERIIFCEGYQGMHNPWFKWLPFQPAKGEILSVEIQEELPRYIINAGRWLMPRGGHTYRLGATYDREQLDEEPTVSGRQTLLAALEELFVKPPEAGVAAHQAGVRPNTLDKQPFVGRHPQQPRMGIFNGFGSKGSLLMPWYAERFVDHLLDGHPIPEESDIRRYWNSAKE